MLVAKAWEASNRKILLMDIKCMKMISVDKMSKL